MVSENLKGSAGTISAGQGEVLCKLVRKGEEVTCIKNLEQLVNNVVRQLLTHSSCSPEVPAPPPTCYIVSGYNK